MRHLLVILAVAFCLPGCIKIEDVQSQADRLMFRKIGGTLFATPELVSMKEVHLDATAAKGRELIFEGDLAEVSDHGTYLILQDESARMLVVLTDVVADGAAPLKKDGPLRLKVWGTLETGMKGLPYVMAKAMTVVPAGANDATKTL